MNLLELGKYYFPVMGGMEQHITLLSRHLSKTNSVSAVVSNSGPRTSIEFDGAVRVVRVARIGTLFSTTLCPTMPRHLRSLGSDLIHVHLPNPMANLAISISRTRLPVVVTYHGDIDGWGPLDPVYRKATSFLLERAERIIVTSANLFRRSNPLSPFADKVEVIPYGVETEALKAGSEPDQVKAIRSAYGPRIILFVGRLVPYKGLSYLVEAASKIDGHILLIGDGPLRPGLENQIRRLSLGGRVHLIGERKNWELAPFYEACDLFVLPSSTKAEAFGIVLLEAMARAKPLVTTELGTGTSSVNVHGLTGRVVPPRSSASLAECINGLLADEQLMHSMGDAGRKRVRDEFLMETVAGRVEMALVKAGGSAS
jgi:glycosyltransferase involved in cell wall biosynthesis